MIQGVSDKTKEIRRDLNLADKKVTEMSKRECCFKAALYGTIVLLLVAIILTLVLKLTHWFQSNLIIYQLKWEF